MMHGNTNQICHRVCPEDVQLSRYLLFVVRLASKLRYIVAMNIQREDIRTTQNTESVASLCLVAHPARIGAQMDSPIRYIDSAARYHGPLIANH
jgi:hypothetical protein